MEHATIASLMMTSTEILKDFNTIKKRDKQIIKQHLDDLDGIVSYLSFALNKISNISNICKNKIIMIEYENKKNITNDVSTINIHNLKMPASMIKNTTKIIAPDINCPVQIVDDISDIPNMCMYWVKPKNN